VMLNSLKQKQNLSVRDNKEDSMGNCRSKWRLKIVYTCVRNIPVVSIQNTFHVNIFLVILVHMRWELGCKGFIIHGCLNKTASFIGVAGVTM